MRTQYRAELAQITDTLVAMADTVRTALRWASAALLGTDADMAQQVITDDADIDAMYRQVEEQVFQLLARQAPVAGDLRLIMTTLQVARDLERMGDLAAHVAKTTLRRAPQPAVPTGLRDVITGMADHAEQMTATLTAALQNRDADTAARLDRDDDTIDTLHQQLFAALLDSTWNHGIAAAIDAAQLGRWYERYADHTVNAGRHVIYLVTGTTHP